MKSMGVDPPGYGGTDTFLQYFNDWFNSASDVSPFKGMVLFFKELRPMDNIRDRMTKMW